MIGVSLITQFVTYPSFIEIDPKRFKNFHEKYSNTMLYIAGPTMIIEAIASFFLIIESFNNDWGKFDNSICNLPIIYRN